VVEAVVAEMVRAVVVGSTDARAVDEAGWVVTIGSTDVAPCPAVPHAVATSSNPRSAEN